MAHFGRLAAWPLVLAAWVGLPLWLASPPTAADDAESYAPITTDDGLLAQPWFLESFLELADDVEEAAAEGKRFAILWEQKGCPYCKTMHTVNFAQPEIQHFVRDNFTILQLNLFGSRRVTDFDGEVLAEKELARKYAIAFTPTVQFFPETMPPLDGAAGKAVEVARMPGYFEPDYFLGMFRFVREEAYRSGDFLSYVRERLQESALGSAAEGDG
ncbi:MAG: thioredoxin family protein [Kiloniellales bacterium]|nr:thioredoxin family protein [Kiloniellales bacterium]